MKHSDKADFERLFAAANELIEYTKDKYKIAHNKDFYCEKMRNLAFAIEQLKKK